MTDRADEPADVGSDDSSTEPGPGSEDGREVPLRGADNAFALFGFEVSLSEDEGPILEMWELGSAKSGLQFPEVGACEGQGSLGGPQDLGNPNYRGIILYQRLFGLGLDEDCADTPEMAEYYRENQALCIRPVLHNRTETSYASVYSVINAVNPPSAQAFAGSRMSDPPRTVELENGEVVILDPWSELGTYHHGPLPSMESPDNEADAEWIWLMRNRPASLGAFGFQGVIWFVVEEICGTGTDDNCDGLADSGCGLFDEGDDCLRDSDCAAGLRCAGATLSGFGECVED